MQEKKSNDKGKERKGNWEKSVSVNKQVIKSEEQRAEDAKSQGHICY